MDLNLKGKTAVVCGSTQGIGKAAAVELSLLGARVVLVARNEDKLKQTLAGLAPGEAHSYLVADFGNPEALKKTIDAFASVNDAHILINNTGGPAPGPALDAAPAGFVDAFNHHLVCNQILVQALVPAMKRSGYGRVINVISTSVKMPIKGLGVSNTIRGAVANWSKTLAAELGPFGITVNNVLPGASMTGRLQAIIRTRAEKAGKTVEEIQQEMIDEIPAGRISTPEEVASAIAFLATPAAAYINGINVPVDGGRTGCL